MITELLEAEFTIECDQCGIQVQVTDQNFALFQLSWYESLLLDLCPLCQTGERIARDRAFNEKARKELEKRLTRTAQDSRQPFSP